MEIKKSLLQAMLVGLTIGGISSCGMFDDWDEATQPTHQVEGENGEEGEKCLNCMACGMG